MQGEQLRKAKEQKAAGDKSASSTIEALVKQLNAAKGERESIEARKRLVRCVVMMTRCFLHSGDFRDLSYWAPGVAWLVYPNCSLRCMLAMGEGPVLQFNSQVGLTWPGAVLIRRSRLTNGWFCFVFAITD
jgi:hypothetical protein